MDECKWCSCLWNYCKMKFRYFLRCELWSARNFLSKFMNISRNWSSYRKLVNNMLVVNIRHARTFDTTFSFTCNVYTVWSMTRLQWFPNRKSRLPCSHQRYLELRDQRVVVIPGSHPHCKAWAWRSTRTKHVL